MKQFRFGVFLWILCLVLAIGQLRYQPGCPRWLRPIPEEARKPGTVPGYPRYSVVAVGVLCWIADPSDDVKTDEMIF